MWVLVCVCEKEFISRLECTLMLCVSVCVIVYNTGVVSHYVLQPSPSLSLLLKPVVSRELLLPCSLPVSTHDPAPDAMQAMQVR